MIGRPERARAISVARRVRTDVFGFAAAALVALSLVAPDAAQAACAVRRVVALPVASSPELEERERSAFDELQLSLPQGVPLDVLPSEPRHVTASSAEQVARVRTIAGAESGVLVLWLDPTAQPPTLWLHAISDDRSDVQVFQGKVGADGLGLLISSVAAFVTASCTDASSPRPTPTVVQWPPAESAPAEPRASEEPPDPDPPGEPSQVDAPPTASAAPPVVSLASVTSPVLSLGAVALVTRRPGATVGGGASLWLRGPPKGPLAAGVDVDVVGGGNADVQMVRGGASGFVSLLFGLESLRVGPRLGANLGVAILAGEGEGLVVPLGRVVFGADFLVHRRTSGLHLGVDVSVLPAPQEVRRRSDSALLWSAGPVELGLRVSVVLPLRTSRGKEWARSRQGAGDAPTSPPRSRS